MLASLIAGFVIGTAFGLYLLYALITPEALLSGVPPRQLFYDAKGEFPQYRDYYAARAASRFIALGGAGRPEALAAARDELGVTTGDTSPEQALSMVRAAQAIATKENAGEQNPDAGRFTLQDQQNLAALGDRLEATKADPIPTATAGNGRTLLRILGLAGLLALTALAAFILWALSKALQPALAENRPPLRAATRPVVEQPITPVYADEDEAEENADLDAPARRESASMASTVDAEMPAGAMRSGVSAPAANEQLIGTYKTAYEIGDDRYDESFPINGSMGELIGECGASVVERVGLESPAKVAALAVWLFDKGDFQSTTKVLMTDFAYNDSAVKEKLKNRGDAVLARNGVFEILTSTMRVEVEVSGLDFAPIGNETNGYFEKVNLQFRVYRKA
jgi:hypothetical protein